MVKISIADEARDYILEQTDTITVQMRLCGGWGGGSYEPAVYAGQPEKTEGYHEVEANGVKVFIPKDASTDPEGVSISMVNGGMRKGLLIEGLLQ